MEVLKGLGNITCAREREEFREMFNALCDGELTKIAQDHFEESTAEVYFNTSSGNVFLSDEEYNTVMMNGDKLDLFINLSYHGTEGFLDELIIDALNGNVPDEDVKELMENWSDYFTEKQKNDLNLHAKEHKIEVQ